MIGFVHLNTTGWTTFKFISFFFQLTDPYFNPGGLFPLAENCVMHIGVF